MCQNIYKCFLYTRRYFFIILLLPQINLSASILFDDQPQNKTSLWSTSSKTVSSKSMLTSNDDPVAEGSHAIAIEASNWTQAGLYLSQSPPDSHSILEAKIYRVAGSNGKLMFRRGNNWLKINLDESNNEHWTLNGEPGTNSYSDDTWHTLQIHLDGFNIEEGEKIIAIGVQGPKGTGYFYMDSVAFVTNKIDKPVIPPIAGQWELSFEEEFNGDMLSPEKWQVGKQYLGMSGIAGNSADNIKVENGHLILTAKKQDLMQGTKSYNYASSEISTYRNFRQKYGYFEARIKYDAVQGSWPAFWLMPDRGLYGSDNYRRQSLLKFSIDDVADTVSSAILQVKISNANTDSSIAVHKTLTTDWSESKVTWETKPQLDPQWFTQRFGEVTGNVMEVDVTDYIQKQKNREDDASFALVDNYMKNQLMYIFSKEAANSNDRPVLIVNGISISPTDDTYVQGGNNAKANYGNEPVIKVKDIWGNTSSTYNGGMEFDIMESLGIWGDDMNAHVLHWDGYDKDHRSASSEELYINNSIDGFHTYGMYWKPGYVAMYVDGIQMWDYTDTRVGSVASYIILSLQMGGWDGNDSMLNEQLPINMLIDYVRVWSGSAD